MSAHLLGVDLGGTKTALVAGDTDGNVFRRVEYPTRPKDGYLAWLSRFRSALSNIRGCALEWSPVCAGISCGGPADWERGVLLEPPNLPGWRDVPVRDDISDMADLPCRMEHDGRAGALAEHRFGAGKGYSSLVFLTFGTGIGAGIILDGRIWRGAAGTAGEVGHVRLADRGPFAYGKEGSVEAFASGTGIARLATLRFPERFAKDTEARDVIALEAQGDDDAHSVLEESSRRLGQTLAMLADVLNPRIIVLGSLAARLPSWYLETARQVLQTEALPANSEACEVVCSALGDRLQDLASLVAATDGQ